METNARRRPDGRGDERPSLAVLTAIMEAEGYEDATEFETCLYDVIDPDALDSIFHRRTENACVEFSLDGYEVHVHSNGSVDIFDG